MQPDGRGGLYLVSAGKVLRRDPKGAIETVASVGSPSGALALGSDGTLYLGDGSDVHAVSRDGRTRKVATGFGEVYGVTVDAAGRLYVADWKGGTVYRVEEGKKEVLARKLDHPSGLALGPKGLLHVKESGRQSHEDMRVRRIDADGTASLLATVDSISRWKRK